MAESTVRYLDPSEISEHKKTTAPHNRSRSGYGSKIPTQHMLKIRSAWHRVYVIQWANAGSAYVLVNGERYFLRDADMPSGDA